MVDDGCSLFDPATYHRSRVCCLPAQRLGDLEWARQTCGKRERRLLAWLFGSKFATIQGIKYTYIRVCVCVCLGVCDCVCVVCIVLHMLSLSLSASISTYVYIYICTQYMWYVYIMCLSVCEGVFSRMHSTQHVTIYLKIVSIITHWHGKHNIKPNRILGHQRVAAVFLGSQSLSRLHDGKVFIS